MDKMSQPVSELTCIPLEEIQAARDRIADSIPRSPLIPLDVDVPGKKVGDDNTVTIFYKLTCRFQRADVFTSVTLPLLW